MPVFALLKREFVTQLRRKKTLGLLLLIMAGSLWCLWEQWPQSGNNIQHVVYRAQELLMTTAMLIGAGAILFVPGIAATTLVSEREQNTWDMLSLTLLESWKIVGAKLVYSVGLYLLLIIGVSPFLASLFFLVGIDLYYTLNVSYIILLGIITFASLGLLASAYQRTTTRAITHSYLYTLVNLGVGYLVVYVLVALVLILIDPSITRMSQVDNVLTFTPIFSSSAMFIQGIDAVSGRGVGGVTTNLVYHTIVQLGTITVALYLTQRRLRRPVEFIVASKKYDPKSKSTSLVPANDFKAIPDKMNPIRFREIHFGIAMKRKGYKAVLLFMLFISGITAYCHFRLGMEMRVVFAITFCINLGLVSLFSLTTMANMFTKEDELKNLDMLKMTLLSPREIVGGKLSAGMRLMNRLTLFSLIINIWFLFPSSINHGMNGWNYSKSTFCLFASHGTLWICGTLCVLFGGLASVLCKKTPTAIVSSFVMASMLYIGNWIGLMLLLDNIRGMSNWTVNNSPMIRDHFTAFGSPPLGLLIIQSEFPFRDHRLFYWSLQMLLYGSIVLGLYVLINNYYRIRRYNSSGSE